MPIFPCAKQGIIVAYLFYSYLFTSLNPIPLFFSYFLFLLYPFSTVHRSFVFYICTLFQFCYTHLFSFFRFHREVMHTTDISVWLISVSIKSIHSRSIHIAGNGKSMAVLLNDEYIHLLVDTWWYAVSIWSWRFTVFQEFNNFRSYKLLFEMAIQPIFPSCSMLQQ